jgi:hypothetical protein
MRIPLRKPSPSMAVSLTALVVAMGGTSYAAVTLKANSVGNIQLKSNAVTGAKVKNGSLSATDFGIGQLPAGRAGAAGPAGPAGPAGAAGAAGARGANGATNVVIRKSRVTIGTDATSSFSADCNTGERATGGGAFFPDDDSVTGDAITESVPTSGNNVGGASGATPNGWYVTVHNNGTSVPLEVYAVCAAP